MRRQEIPQHLLWFSYATSDEIWCILILYRNFPPHYNVMNEYSFQFQRYKLQNKVDPMQKIDMGQMIGRVCIPEIYHGKR